MRFGIALIYIEQMHKLKCVFLLLKLGTSVIRCSHGKIRIEFKFAAFVAAELYSGHITGR